MGHRNLNRRFRNARKRARKSGDSQEFDREVRNIRAIQDREVKEHSLNETLDSEGV